MVQMEQMELGVILVVLMDPDGPLGQTDAGGMLERVAEMVVDSTEGEGH